jgi:3-deoxy-7-phosphoheptulonate synthase
MRPADAIRLRPLAPVARTAGAHGVMIKIHPDPADALSDGPQSLDFDQFKAFARKLV